MENQDIPEYETEVPTPLTYQEIVRQTNLLNIAAVIFSGKCVTVSEAVDRAFELEREVNRSLKNG
jgi:hypothetical protein